ncbi:hypothetical protein ACFVS7_07985 [Streptomyces rubiginosohelvolus]|uniref:hypothetical protein n=1 Tax=Streptomyces rubiginosohelvolus TaxID=67362 RepID=UPI0036DD70E8
MTSASYGGRSSAMVGVGQAVGALERHAESKAFAPEAVVVPSASSDALTGVAEVVTDKRQEVLGTSAVRTYTIRMWTIAVVLATAAVVASSVTEHAAARWYAPKLPDTGGAALTGVTRLDGDTRR